jgi:hypothetical protein
MRSSRKFHYQFSKREIFLLATFVVVTIVGGAAAFNWRHLRFRMPFFQALAQKEMLLDMNGALIRFKMQGEHFNLLAPKTPLPVLFEILRHYMDTKSHLLELGPDEYHDLMDNLKHEGNGVEYTFTHYKSARYP